MPKKTAEIEAVLSPVSFSGEGNPSDMTVVDPGSPVRGHVDIKMNLTRVTSGKADWLLEMSEQERLVLRKVLDRERTSKMVHGGLKSILQLSDEDAVTFINFLKRI